MSAYIDDDLYDRVAKKAYYIGLLRGIDRAKEELCTTRLVTIPAPLTDSEAALLRLACEADRLGLN